MKAKISSLLCFPENLSSFSQSAFLFGNSGRPIAMDCVLKGPYARLYDHHIIIFVKA